MLLDLRLCVRDRGRVPFFFRQEALGENDSSGVARKLDVAQLHVHVDQGPAARVGRHQRRAWPRCLEIIEDCGRLEKDEAILLERRHATIRVERQIRLFSMPARRHVHDDEFVRNLLLGECDQNPARIGRERMIVQLDSHGMFPQDRAPLCATAEQGFPDRDANRRIQSPQYPDCAESQAQPAALAPVPQRIDQQGKGCRGLTAAGVVELIACISTAPSRCPRCIAGACSKQRSGIMEIKRNGSQPSAKGSADYFTGAVRIDPLFEAPEPARVRGASVTFEPGARTAWHTHPLGQTLIVTSGLGWAQRWGGAKEEIRPGDVVWFPPGEKHWHGAAPATAMTHIAVQEALNGKVVDWMEHVTDQQYRT